MLSPAAGRTTFRNILPNYREYVYVTNGGSDTVTVLDVVNVRVDRELPVGQHPVAVAASPTRNEIYVVNAGAAGANGSISVIDAEHNTVVATIAVHRQPLSIDLDADGRARLCRELRIEFGFGDRSEGAAGDCADWRRRSSR